MKKFSMRKKAFAPREKRPFLTLFLSGFVLGVFYISVFGKAAVHETSLMSTYFFSKYQYVEILAEELFVYVLKSRLSVFTVLWLTGLTVLGTTVAYVYLFWTGASLGITATVAAVKMGFSGILLCMGSGLPQFVLYAPLLVWALKKVCEMSGSPDVRTRQTSSGKKKFYAYVLVWILGTVLLFAGAFLESYVNPIFVKSILKNL